MSESRWKKKVYHLVSGATNALNKIVVRRRLPYRTLARPRASRQHEPPVIRRPLLGLRTDADDFHSSRTSIRWRGSGGSSPRSTRLTISVSAAFAGVRMPISSPLRAISPLMKSISVRRPFTMSWPIDGRCSPPPPPPRDLAEWRSLFRRSDIKFATLPRLDDVVNDPQMRAANAVVKFDYPGANGLETVNSPVFVSGVEKRKPTAAPEVGEHTREVLQQLGYSADEIESIINHSGHR